MSPPPRCNWCSSILDEVPSVHLCPHSKPCEGRPDLLPALAWYLDRENNPYDRVCFLCQFRRDAEWTAYVKAHLPADAHEHRLAKGYLCLKADYDADCCRFSRDKADSIWLGLFAQRARWSAWRLATREEQDDAIRRLLSTIPPGDVLCFRFMDELPPELRAACLRDNDHPEILRWHAIFREVNPAAYEAYLAWWAQNGSAG